ncbi:hypothetical protein [Plantactinospora sp. CA-290183]|uniref:hypothetical protein n=1 Tax=Plantactinospora sp. CA-290183 TaxID=3240006 RepID=UPI003D8DC844
MLTRRMFTAGATAGLLLAAALTTGATPASARAPGAECPAGQPHCNVWDNDPGDDTGGDDGGGSDTGGGDGSGGGSRVCKKDDGTTVPCYDNLRGWFNSDDDCYYKRAEPQPAGVPAGQTAYFVSCSSGLANSDTVFLPDPPPGFDPPDPEQVARDLLASLPLARPVIRTAPQGRPGLVGIPVWLYDASSWNTEEESDEVGGVSVSIAATPNRIVWAMGNGDTETCATAGIPFRAGAHDPRRPPGDACAYPGYPRSSRGQDGGAYEITATKHWRVPWSGGGESGVLTASLSDTGSIQIDELQVVTG